MLLTKTKLQYILYLHNFNLKTNWHNLGFRRLDFVIWGSSPSVRWGLVPQIAKSNLATFLNSTQLPSEWAKIIDFRKSASLVIFLLEKEVLYCTFSRQLKWSLQPTRTALCLFCVGSMRPMSKQDYSEPQTPISSALYLCVPLNDLNHLLKSTYCW